MRADPKILERLRKILVLANDKGAQPGEVEAAMARAKAIAVEHNLELSSIDLTDPKQAKSAINIEANDTLRIRSMYRQPYHKWIWNVLQSVFGVDLVYNFTSTSGGCRINRITIIGDSVDVLIATTMHPYLEKIFPALLTRYLKDNSFEYCAAHMNGFYRGLAVGIMYANQQEEEKVKENDRYALVVRDKKQMIEEKKKEMFPKVKARSARDVLIDEEAKNRGFREGQKINLRR